MAKAEPLVLLVDDDDDTREMYTLNLAMTRIRTEGARNAEEAWRQIEAKIPDLVVTDVMLPRSSGLELCRRIKQDERTSRIPVIALTGRTVDHDTMVAVAAGCESVLTKPCPPDELRREIQRVLRRTRDLRMKTKMVKARAPSRLERATPCDRSQVLASRALGRRAAIDPANTPVPCPHCGQPLTWLETQTLSGIRYDYFARCQSGCGEYFFDHAMRKFRRFRR